MEGDHLFFLKNNEDQSYLEKEVTTMLEADPSTFRGHDSSSFKVGDTVWTMTALQLPRGSVRYSKNLPAIEGARKREGMLVLGSGPNFKDGRCRLVYSFIHPWQLAVDPFGLLKKSAFVSKLDSHGSIFGFRCLRVGDLRIPHEPGVRNIHTNAFYGCSANQVLSNCPAEELGTKAALNGRLHFFLPQDNRSVYPYIIVAPCTKVLDFLVPTLRTDMPLFCNCLTGLTVNRIKVTLKEYTSCKVKRGSSLDIETEVRSIVLQDRVLNDKIDWSDFEKRDGFIIATPPKSLYCCWLPNLGPTFFSDNCTRTYAIRFSISVECTNQRCSSEFWAEIKINVAVEDHNSSLRLRQPQLKKVQDMVFFDECPWSPSVLQDVRQSVAKKTIISKPAYLEHHTCSYFLDNKLHTCISISSRKLRPPKKADHNSRRRNDEKLIKSLPDGGFSSDGSHTVSNSSEIQLWKSPFLSLFSKLEELNNYQPTFGNLHLSAILSGDYGQFVPGSNLKNALNVYILGPQGPTLSLRAISMMIVMKSTRVIQQSHTEPEEKVFELKTTRFKEPVILDEIDRNVDSRLTGVDGKRKCVTIRIPAHVTSASIPKLLPSVLSRSLHREYFIVVKVDLERQNGQNIRLGFFLPIHPTPPGSSEIES